MKKNILIFDFDGTIADTFHHFLGISYRLAAEFKFRPVEPHEIEKLKDKTIKDIMRHLQVPVLKVPLIIAKASEELHKEIASIKPIEDLKEILIQLQSLGIEMGILTSNTSKNVMKFLKNHDLDVFDFIHTSSKLLGKNHSLDKLVKKGKFALNEVIYIGDEIRDIEAAKKAGVRVAAVTWGYNSQKALMEREPDYLMTKPKDLFGLCKN